MEASHQSDLSARELQQKKKESMYVEGFTGNDWGDKVTFTVGVSYFGACVFGLARGLYDGYPKNWKLPKKLIINNWFNMIGRYSAKYGNSCAAASLMYCLMGKSLNFFFEDELAELTQLQQNMICGALTGGLYKSTRGARPFVVGSVLGGAISVGLHQTFGFLNDKGMIAFEMKY